MATAEIESLAAPPPPMARLGATRQEVDGTVGVATYMGGGPSLMYAASAVAAFDEALAAQSAAA